MPVHVIASSKSELRHGLTHTHTLTKKNEEKRQEQ